MKDNLLLLSASPLAHLAKVSAIVLGSFDDS